MFCIIIKNKINTLIYIIRYYFKHLPCSENSTNSSGEPGHYLMPPGSTEDLSSGDTSKRQVLDPFVEFEAVPSELDFYYGIG